MNAKICNSGDDNAVARLRAVLAELKAEVIEEGWALGLDVYSLRIGSEQVIIQSDGWAVDIEGPDALVQQIVNAVAAGAPSQDQR